MLGYGLIYFLHDKFPTDIFVCLAFKAIQQSPLFVSLFNVKANQTKLPSFVRDFPFSANSFIVKSIDKIEGFRLLGNLFDISCYK